MTQHQFLQQISEAFVGPATVDQLFGLAVFAIVIIGFIVSGILHNMVDDKNSPWDSY